MALRSRLVPDEDLAVKRQTNRGAFDADGFPTPAIFTEFNIKGNIQPISGLEILQVPEGDRTREIFNLWTATPLTTDDIIVRNTTEYEVQVVQDWLQQNLQHFRARIVKKDAG